MDPPTNNIKTNEQNKTKSTDFIRKEEKKINNKVEKIPDNRPAKEDLQKNVLQNKNIMLNELENAYDSGSISKEEYGNKKKEIKEIPENEPVKEEVKEEKVEEPKLKSDKIIIIIVAVVVLILAGIFSIRFFIDDDRPLTIDEMHQMNLKGKLEESEGYLYNDAYSFINYSGLWYLQLVSPQGSRFYNLQFRFGPKEVESIPIGGAIDLDLFNEAEDYYVTFNPNGSDFSNVALAVGDFNTQMTKVFLKKPIAACDREGHDACLERPIITCGNTDKVVLYVKESNFTSVYYNDNCIVIEGSGLELVKGIDRILYDLYEIID